MAQHTLVTGGEGFVASHIITTLLERGYIVTTTVRVESEKIHLRNMFAIAVNEERLRFAIVEDMGIQGAYDQVIKSVRFDAVLHTASPTKINDRMDPKKDAILPAINGTLGILKSVKSYGPHVKRVVITSSFAAMMSLRDVYRPGYVYSEKDWNSITEEEACSGGPFATYAGSKVFAEKVAWEFVRNEQPKFDLVTLCCGWIHGPSLREVSDLADIKSSSTDIYRLFSGKERLSKSVKVWLWVDVRDCALAHVLAIEKPTAGNQRFLISEGNFNFSQVIDLTWKYYPERATAKGIPKGTVEDEYPPGGVHTCDNSKSREILGLSYRSFESTVKDLFDHFIELEKRLGVE